MQDEKRILRTETGRGIFSKKPIFFTVITYGTSLFSKSVWMMIPNVTSLRKGNRSAEKSNFHHLISLSYYKPEKQMHQNSIITNFTMYFL
jgi:hypothetical protein